MKTKKDAWFVKRRTEKLCVPMNKFLRKIMDGKRLKLINDRKKTSQFLET